MKGVYRICKHQKLNGWGLILWFSGLIALAWDRLEQRTIIIGLVKYRITWKQWASVGGIEAGQWKELSSDSWIELSFTPVEPQVLSRKQHRSWWKKTLFVETLFCLIEDEIILSRPITSTVARNTRYVQSDKKFIVSCGSKWWWSSGVVVIGEKPIDNIWFKASGFDE